MHALTAPLSELAEIEEICEERGREPGMLLLSGCVTSQKTHLMYALGKGYGHTLIVLSSEDKAKKIYEEYRFLNENTSYYPAKDLLFYQADIHGKQLVKQRMETLQMMEAKSQVTVITTIDGFMDELPSEAEIKGDILTISNGEALEFESLKEKIIKLGYDREAQVDGPGQFAVRGGIIDIYPLTEELPIRIEFWGDEVDSIRTFDVDSQRSVENLEQIVIYPADDRLGSDRKVSLSTTLIRRTHWCSWMNQQGFWKKGVWQKMKWKKRERTVQKKWKGPGKWKKLRNFLRLMKL